jgi:alpha-glucosidase
MSTDNLELHPTARDLDWWQTAVVYQIYPRSFADSNGDGLGDLPGITERLDYIKDLGVDAIWLSPIFRSPMIDFGYDISDHTDIDPRFGTLADAEHLIDAAHLRGIRVVFDIVLGHTSDQHAWFQAAASSREDPHRAFYVWRDGPTPGSPAGGPPTNWTAGFPAGALAWTWHEPTTQWYLHSHLPQQPDLNWENPAVVDAQLDVLRFWLDRGVDGVRLDSINRLGKDPALRDNVPGLPPRQQDWPSVHDHLRTVRKVIDTYASAMAVGEVWLFDQRELMPYLAADELHLAHNFVFVRLPFTAKAFATAISEFTELADDDVWPAWFLNNHDEPRTASRFETLGADGRPDGRGLERARLVAMLLLTLRGTPFLYQGEELGLPDTPVPAEIATDQNGRDPQRTPIPWLAPSEAGPGAGFTTATPWLPIGPTAQTLNVGSEQRDPASTLHLYRNLLRLRKTRASLRQGDEEILVVDDGDLLVYLRTAADGDTLVVLNFSTENSTVDLNKIDQIQNTSWTVALSTHSVRSDFGPFSGTVALSGLEGVVLI